IRNQSEEFFININKWLNKKCRQSTKNKHHKRFYIYCIYISFVNDHKRKICNDINQCDLSYGNEQISTFVQLRNRKNSDNSGNNLQKHIFITIRHNKS